MNDLYGVDPAAPSSAKEFFELMHRFRSGEGRFIAAFPADWFRDVSQNMRVLTDLQQKAMLEKWIEIGKNAVLPMDAAFDLTLPWGRNAVTLQSHGVKRLIGKKICPAPMIPIDRALIDPDVFPDARGALIPRTADAYAEVARPLLKTSPTVVLVDPYFRLREFDEGCRDYRPVSRFRDTLEAFFREAAKWKRVELFKFAISESQAFSGDRYGKLFKTEVRKLADSCGAQAIKLEFVVLSDRLTTHPRYLLGMHSGLRFDWGFDTGDPKSKNDIQWLGDAVLKPLLAEFT
jgi:hypothetical protein